MILCCMKSTRMRTFSNKLLICRTVKTIVFCRTVKRQKSMSFPYPKIWNKLTSNIKTAAITHRLKKGILGKLQE